MTKLNQSYDIVCNEIAFLSKILITKTLILARRETHDPRTCVASLPRIILLIQTVLRPCAQFTGSRIDRSLTTNDTDYKGTSDQNNPVNTITLSLLG